MTNEELCTFFEVSSNRTLYNWCDKHPDFKEAMKAGKTLANANVAMSLYKRAIGYSYSEETKELRINPETGRKEMTVTKIISKHVPPETLAGIFWMKNREPDKWRDKQTVQHEVDSLGSKNINLVMKEGLTPETLNIDSIQKLDK